MICELIGWPSLPNILGWVWGKGVPAYWVSKLGWCTRLTGLGQKQIGFLAHEMRDAVVDGIDGLLHGLHPQTQCPILLLQHGVLPEQVTVALGTVLPDHPLALGRGGAGQAGSSQGQELAGWGRVDDVPGSTAKLLPPTPRLLKHSSCLPGLSLTTRNSKFYHQLFSYSSHPPNLTLTYLSTAYLHITVSSNPRAKTLRGPGNWHK